MPSQDDWADDIADLYVLEEPEDALRLLSSFTRPLAAGEAEYRSQLHHDAGVLTSETIVRALLGEFNG